MKSNCGWGNDSVIIVKDKNHIAWDYECAKMTQWLYPWTSYYYKNMGASTEKIVPRILIEEFIGDDSGLDDYKFYCFNGEPQFALTVSGRNEGTQSRTFVDMDWKPLPIRRGGKATAGFPKKPENVEKMIELARVLSKDFPLVRVDFYEVAGQVIVGELTFTPGMFLRLNPLEMDYIIGDKLDISELVQAKNNKSFLKLEKNHSVAGVLINHFIYLICLVSSIERVDEVSFLLKYIPVVGVCVKKCIAHLEKSFGVSGVRNSRTLAHQDTTSCDDAA